MPAVTNDHASQPEIAVIISAFQSAAYLEEAIRSALAQTLPPAEICVGVDMGSTDASLAIAESFAPAVRAVPVPRSGAPGVTRQAAADETQSPFLALLDADDVWFPEKLERQYELLASDPSLDGVFCHVDEFLSPELTPEQRRAVRAPMTGVKGRIGSTLMIKRNGLERVGGFGTRAHPAEWIEWVSKAEGAGLRFGVSPEVLVRRRIHSSNLTLRHAGRFGAMLGAIRSHLSQNGVKTPADGGEAS